MKERPILFSGPMVRAILDGRKTQTRRIVKPQPDWKEKTPGEMASAGWSWKKGKTELSHWPDSKTFSEAISEFCPYGKTGDRLWVRETACFLAPEFINAKWLPFRPDSKLYNPFPNDDTAYKAEIIYRANGEFGNGYRLGDGLRWTPSIHIPHWASRITLEITNIRVERLHDISEEDAIAEGIEPTPGRDGHNDRWLIKSSKSLDGIASTNNPVIAYKQLWELINGSGSWEANPWVWVVEFKRIK